MFLGKVFMTTVISFASQKGGVGKTTSAVNLSVALAFGGYKVLLIDLDPQGSIQASFGLPLSKSKGTLQLFCESDTTLDQIITQTEHENLDFILSNISLLEHEKQVSEKATDYHFLRHWIEREIGSNYDFVILDPPATTGPISINGLVASDLGIVPLQCEALAIKSLKRFLVAFRDIQNNVDRNIRIAGILLTMYDKNQETHRIVARQVYEALQDSVFKVHIPKCSEILTSSALGKSVINKTLSSIGATAYVRLANEILDRFNLR